MSVFSLNLEIVQPQCFTQRSVRERGCRFNDRMAVLDIYRTKNILSSSSVGKLFVIEVGNFLWESPSVNRLPN